MMPVLHKEPYEAKNPILPGTGFSPGLGCKHKTWRDEERKRLDKSLLIHLMLLTKTHMMTRFTFTAKHTVRVNTEKAPLHHSKWVRGLLNHGQTV